MMDTVETIRSSCLIAIARGIFGADLLGASEALYEAGVRAFEVTFIQNGDFGDTLESIELLASRLPADAAVGAGTVMSGEQAVMASRAGARFIISPNTDGAVIRKTKELGLASVPGAMTPTEIARAYSFGADVVKVFPAGILGAEYFKAVRAPLPHIPLAAVAGVTPDNIAEFKKAGAVAFGISSSLYIADAVRDRDYKRISAAAKRFYSALNN